MVISQLLLQINELKQISKQTKANPKKAWQALKTMFLFWDKARGKPKAMPILYLLGYESCAVFSKV